MKLKLIGAIICLQTVAFAQGIFLNTGGAYVMEFTSLTYQGPAQPTQASLFFARFTPGSFYGNESLRIDLFPNALSETPLSYTFVAPRDPQEHDPEALYRATVFWSFSDPPLWPDLQGVVRITMLTGDAELDGIGIHQIVDGSSYIQFFPVPEPSTFALLLAGLALLVARRYH